jgi:hypothetical protein
VETSTDPIITTPAPENTPILETILMTTVLMELPQPGMEPLPDQQQAYQEEQQVRAHAWQINAEWWAVQHHDELTGERPALDAQMIELHRCKAALGIERTATINHEGTPHPTFRRASQNVVVALLDTLLMPSIDGVGRVYQ